MKSTLFPGILFSLAGALSASAANIAWVSFHSGDNAPTAAAVTAGFTKAPDIGYTNLLAANGHTVTRIVQSGTPNAALLNSFDLIIVGRSVASGSFQGAGATAWNALTAPTIMMSGYTLRASRAGFTTGETMPDTFIPTDAIVDTIRLTVNNPAHPVFAGVSLDGSNTTVNAFASEVTFGTNVQAGISVNNNPLAGSGTLLARVGTAGDPAVNGPVIAEWLAGATMANTPASVLGGHRLVFLSGSRERGITSEAAGIFDLTADGTRMLLNAVDYMAVPEPTTFTLGVLGAACLLRRRRH